MSDQGNLLPIYKEIDADLETPVSAYLKVAKPPYSFLLESVEGESIWPAIALSVQNLRKL